MQRYVKAITAMLECDQNEMAGLIRAALEEQTDIEVENYHPRVGAWREATINDSQVTIITIVVATQDGDVISIATARGSAVYIDAELPYVDEVKTLHERILMGEHLLSTAEIYIQFPHLVK